MINREAKKFFDYYLRNVETEEYRSYLKKAEQEGLKNHRKYIEEEHPDWIDRIDYFDEYLIGSFIILDTLSNDGVNKLAKRLYSLPKSKFKVTNYFRKPGFLKKFDYVHLEYSRYEVGTFATIDIIGDKFLRNIEINWSKINSYYAVFEYTFHFNQALTNSDLQLLITDNINKFSSKDYLDWYYINSKDDESNYLAIQQITGNLLSLICQHYITTFLYSEQGKVNKLINLMIVFRKEKLTYLSCILETLVIVYIIKKIIIIFQIVLITAISFFIQEIIEYLILVFYGHYLVMGTDFITHFLVKENCIFLKGNFRSMYQVEKG